MTGRRWKAAALAAVVTGGAVLALANDGSAATLVARADLVNVSGARVGTVKFYDNGDGTITGRVSASLPTDSTEFHGFHIHWNNDPANGDGCIVGDPAKPFLAVDGHYNPTGAIHGGHLGDLPSLARQSDGTAAASFILDKFAAADLPGRAVIIHSMPDNFANVPIGPAVNQYTDNGTAFVGTSATGDAGTRYACGVIAATTG